MLRIAARGLTLLLLGTLLGTLLGCGTRPLYYPNSLEKNVTVNLKVTVSTTASAMTKLDTRMSVNAANPDCTYDYLGTVVLTNGENKIGLAPGKSAALVFLISRTGPFTSDKDFLFNLSITPMPSRQYEIDFNYVDGLIDLRLYEQGGLGRKELPRSANAACRAEKRTNG